MRVSVIEGDGFAFSGQNALIPANTLIIVMRRTSLVSKIYTSTSGDTIKHVHSGYTILDPVYSSDRNFTEQRAGFNMRRRSLTLAYNM